MAPIDGIVAIVDGLPLGADGSLTLAASDFAGTDVVQEFFTSVLGAASCTLGSATKTPGTTGITVGGRADVLGYSDVAAAITFATMPWPATGGSTPIAAPPAGDGVTVSVSVTLVSDGPTALPIVSWIKVDDVTVAATVAEPYDAITFGYAGSIPLDGGSIPIVISRRDSGLWSVEAVGAGAQPVTVTQLVGLLAGHALGSFLPPTLVDALDDLALTDLTIIFDTVGKVVTEARVGLAVEIGWSPIPQVLTLRPGLGLSLAVASPAGAVSNFVGIVTGTLDVAGTDVPVFVQADFESGTSTWLVGLDPAGDPVRLPNLSQLLNLVGGDGFADHLPPQLATLPTITIDQVLFEFTLDPAELLQVSVGVATDSTWQLIEGFLEVTKVTANFELVSLARAAKGITGSLSAVFEIDATVWLYFQVSKKDPAVDTWILSGGVPAGHVLHLGHLATTLLAEWIAVPPILPDLVLDRLVLSGEPGVSLSFEAASDTRWPVFAGFEIDSFELNFDYVAGDQPPFSGFLAASMTIAKTPVAIRAELSRSDAWSFTGTTGKGAAINVADLIDDLANTFKVSAIPESALGGLTIDDLRVAFSAGSAKDGLAQFTFDCRGAFTIADADLDIVVHIELDRATSVCTGTFTGKLTLTLEDGTCEQIDVTLVGGLLTAEWTAITAGYDLKLTDLAHALGFTDRPEVPAAVDLGLAELELQYDVSSRALSVTATTTSDCQAVFVSAMVSGGGTSARRFAFAVELPLQVRLADLPLVGGKLGEAGQLGIDKLGCWIVSGELTGTGPASAAAALDKLIPTG